MQAPPQPSLSVRWRQRLPARTQWRLRAAQLILVLVLALGGVACGTAGRRSGDEWTAAQRLLASSRGADSACSAWPKAASQSRDALGVIRQDPSTGTTCFQGPRDVPVRLDDHWLCPGAADYTLFQKLDAERVARLEVSRDRAEVGRANCPGWHDGVILVRLKPGRDAT